ncbi:MAG: hypothetical protein U1E17_22145 [Geminicoccaceae bacterium]
MIHRIDAVSHRPFQSTVFDATEDILACGGWVKNHHFYSTMMATIAFEMPAPSFPAFVQALAAHGIIVDAPSRWPAGEDDVAGQLTISFSAGGPEIRRAVPAVG